MDQFNNNTYKKRSPLQEFTNSCGGKVIILLALSLILSVVAILTVPSERKTIAATEDNIRQCLQDNDSIPSDAIDEIVANISRTFSEADTTVNDKERVDTYHKYNRLEFYNHILFSTARIVNNTHPQGVRAGWGIFGLVISTIYYEDLIMTNGPARGKYNEKLLPTELPDDYNGENPMLKPYHYKGNPED